eukprot:5565158-Amphidinium_carterae.1
MGQAPCEAFAPWSDSRQGYSFKEWLVQHPDSIHKVSPGTYDEKSQRQQRSKGMRFCMNRTEAGVGSV